jgi:hypothetical protein
MISSATLEDTRQTAAQVTQDGGISTSNAMMVERRVAHEEIMAATLRKLVSVGVAGSFVDGETTVFKSRGDAQARGEVALG